ncbi:Acyltransferase ChoActase/COT/CPT [Aphelenchoides avenae]|nr:Acyltransferase ChoActase/COT/CPT [Aphelenchus avenae]
MLPTTILQRVSFSGARISVRSISATPAVETDEYQYLHKSEIPTYHFQKSLRRLPIPKLEESCERYLAAVKAISSETQFREAQGLTKAFLEGEGPALQKHLKAYDNAHPDTSFISEPWFEMYLKSRVPVPINYNPFMMFAPDPDPNFNDQLTRATNFAIACGRFKRALDADLLAPEVYHLDPKKSDTKIFRRVCKLLPSRVSWFGAVAFKAFPLDMSQYASLFGGNRIPHRGKDRLHHCKDARHFLVMHNGNFYTVDLFDARGKLHSPKTVHACLAHILSGTDKPAADDHCVGSLTTLDRDTWADLRADLVSDRINNLSIQAVDDALFLLCLDDLKTTEHYRLIDSLLCGDDGRNRWFDKCFQLIVDKNGQATINFEHSWGDGVAVLRLMEETLLDTVKHRFVRADTKPSADINLTEHLKKLEWNLDDSLRGSIRKAQQAHRNHAQGLEFGLTEYFGLNRDSIKQCKVSPDSVMQLAIQMAFYRQYKEFVPTYESASTAAFLKGRTECVRSATTATREAVLAFADGGKNTAQMKELIKKCSDVHGQLTKEAAIGKGFDRHLLGLKITAERLGKPTPAFFESEIYKRMGHFVLSTSTLSTETIVFGAFGPVVPDGYGIAYNVVPSKLGAVVSSFKSQRDAKKMAGLLSESLDEIKSVIEAQ